MRIQDGAAYEPENVDIYKVSPQSPTASLSAKVHIKTKREHHASVSIIELKCLEMEKGI